MTPPEARRKLQKRGYSKSKERPRPPRGDSIAVKRSPVPLFVPSGHQPNRTVTVRESLGSRSDEPAGGDGVGAGGEDARRGQTPGNETVIAFKQVPDFPPRTGQNERAGLICASARVYSRPSEGTASLDMNI
ncbi:unnamed protein product [Protopolystoma xenopodis]|uniref:Uncharacterized protein n=1 Tax=Protopolystoma xenopodis TaxID=117903 RepID=A0A3S5BSG8_9PLAT|nr:unnamed protein product [Protopolystoma xenopodis]